VRTLGIRGGEGSGDQDDGLSGGGDDGDDGDLGDDDIEGRCRCDDDSSSPDEDLAPLRGTLALRGGGVVRPRGEAVRKLQRWWRHIRALRIMPRLLPRVRTGSGGPCVVVMILVL
jgi:hypothetical protein